VTTLRLLSGIISMGLYARGHVIHTHAHENGEDVRTSGGGYECHESGIRKFGNTDALTARLACGCGVVYSYICSVCVEFKYDAVGRR